MQGGWQSNTVNAEGVEVQARIKIDFDKHREQQTQRQQNRDVQKWLETNLNTKSDVGEIDDNKQYWHGHLRLNGSETTCGGTEARANVH